MTDPLIDERGRVRDLVRENRQARRRVLLLVAGAVAVLLVLIGILTSSPLLSVRKIVVTGNKVVSADTLKQAAGIALGTPLARVDATAASKRLSAVPGVGRGDVAITLPDTVTLKISERTVAFVVQQAGGYAWVDPTGAVFSSSGERPAGVPLAKAALDNPALLADVGTVVGALPAKVVSRVQQVDATTRDSITISLNQGSTILWGSAEHSPLKGQVADALARRSATCKKIDVSAPSHPVTRC